MKEEQEIVRAWLRRIMYEKELTAERWAKAAGLSGTTITRSMQSSYSGVLSLPTIHRLAVAAGVPSPLDFLRGDQLKIENGSVCADETHTRREIVKRC